MRKALHHTRNFTQQVTIPIVGLFRKYTLTASVVAFGTIASGILLTLNATNTSAQSHQSATDVSSVKPLTAKTAAVQASKEKQTTRGTSSVAVQPGTNIPAATSPSPTATNKPGTSTKAAPSTKPQLASTPAPVTTPGTCLECGGEPAKVPTSTGVLILSAPTLTVPAGGVNQNNLTARSDTGELITYPYMQLTPGGLMLGTSPRGDSNAPTYENAKTFSFNASPGTTPGNYTVKIMASGVNGGRFYATLTIVIVNP